MPKSLNEISKGTLHSYRDKARLQSKVNKRNAQTMDNVAKQRAKAGDNKGMSQALDSAKRKRMVAYKRDAGSDKALQKLRTKAKDEANYHKDMAAQGPHKAPSDKEMKKMAKYYNAEETNKKVKNCGCGKDPCETYGSKEQQMQEIAQSSTINHMLTPAKNVKVLKKGTVSELDDKTLKSYEDKAVADADKKRKAGDYAGHSKRYSGIHKSQMKRLSRATDRLKKSASDLRQATNKYLNKEGTYDNYSKMRTDFVKRRGEQLTAKEKEKANAMHKQRARDDIKRKMAKAYGIRLETLNERGLSASEKRNREDIVKGMKKNKTDFMKRYGRDHEAVMYATATKLAKQDEETIKEISTDTLVNYAKAADASMKKDSSKQNVKKRIKGLANVGKKLADRKFNEETINELDKETLKSYVGKAQAERLHNIDKFEKQSKRGESIIAKSALKKVQKRGMGIRQAQKKLGEAEYDEDKPKRGIQRKRVNLQFGRQQRYKPTPFKKDQQQDLYKKSDPIEKKIRKSRE